MEGKCGRIEEDRREQEQETRRDCGRRMVEDSAGRLQKTGEWEKTAGRKDPNRSKMRLLLRSPLFFSSRQRTLPVYSGVVPVRADSVDSKEYLKRRRKM
ncbi:UNVERIFIED_CONTAM: hypothetical protein PYX00_008537 [Menopon gallinae]|uniref:Uncharacterized protein n=1 Tax=Menopon gallinae TaxID=328185 RepID=A0AAW2HNQ9_9NEOP